MSVFATYRGKRTFSELLRFREGTNIFCLLDSNITLCIFARHNFPYKPSSMLFSLLSETRLTCSVLAGMPLEPMAVFFALKFTQTLLTKLFSYDRVYEIVNQARAFNTFRRIFFTPNFPYSSPSQCIHCFHMSVLVTEYIQETGD